MVQTQQPLNGAELFWQAESGEADIPFCVNLPLNVGPPPYLSKQACIRYILCSTLVIKIGDQRSVISQTWNIQLLTVFDPYKALSSLPEPLIATDSVRLSTSTTQTITITAGLHRQTWLHGGLIFADIHIVNNSERTIKKFELQLEKVTMWYSHAAANSGEKVAHHLRLPRGTESEVVGITSVKRSKDWKGITARSSDVRTCTLEVPRGHVTVGTGRFFEVRYFLNVIVTIGLFKGGSVQLPVTLIHPNSLDIMPNALAQVAASIEAKRSRILPLTSEAASHVPYHQGQMFEAAQQASLKHKRRHASGASSLEGLMQELDNLPRKHGQHQHACGKIEHVESTEDVDGGVIQASHGHLARHPSCYHCHLVDEQRRRSTSQSRAGPRLPRLQTSTSGLNFSESEFEIKDSPPKKVMLSEQERAMIKRGRELQRRHEWTRRNDSAVLARANVDRNMNAGYLKSGSVQQDLLSSSSRFAPIRKPQDSTLNQQRLPARTRTQTHLASIDPNVRRPLSSRRNKSESSPGYLRKGSNLAKNPLSSSGLSDNQRGKQRSSDPFLQVPPASPQKNNLRRMGEDKLTG